MFRRLFVITLCIILTVIAISPELFASEPETRGMDESAVRSAIKAFNGDFEEYVESLIDQQQAIYDLIEIISDDFNDDLTYGSGLDDDKVLEFYDKLIEVYPDMLTAYLKGYEMIDSWNEMESELLSGTRSGEPYGGEDTRFLLTAGVLVVGLGMMAYSGYKATKGAFNKNADISKKIVDDCASSDLDEINDVLGLDPGTSKEDIKAHIDSLPLAQKNIAARNIQELDMTVSLKDSPTHATEIKQGHAEIAQDVGKEGVKIYASAITTVTGGQGVDKIAKALGASEGAAAAVDVVLTVSEKQPLDYLAKSVETGMTSKTKENVKVDKPEETKSTSDAKKVLKDAADGKDVKQEDLENAGDSLAQDVVNKNTEDLKTSEDWYGDTNVQLPEKAIVDTHDEMEDGDKITVPAIGDVDVVVTSDETAPETIKNVDLDEYEDEPEIEVDFEDVDDMDFEPSDIPIDIVFCIDVTGSMSDDIAEVIASANDMLFTTSMQTSNFRFGFVCFRDIYDDSVPFERMAFSDDYYTIQSNINVLQGMVYGGGDYPESVYEGLSLAYNMPFREDADHSVILMGDAPPKVGGGSRAVGTRATYDNVTQAEIDALIADPPTMESLVELSKEKSISVYSVVVGNWGSSDVATTEAFENISAQTGGKRFDAEDASAVPDVLMSVISTAIDKAEDEQGDDDDDDDGDLGNATCCSSAMVFIPAVIALGISLVLPAIVMRRKRKQ